MTLFEIILLIMAFVFCCIITLKEAKQFKNMKRDIDINTENIECLISDFYKLKSQISNDIDK